MKTSLKSVTFSNFRSFQEPVSIEFPRSGLVLIRGKNLDSPGVSSGTGKSNIFLAIAHALGISPFPATELQSWLTEEPLSVEVELETEEGAALLRKGPKSYIEFQDTRSPAAHYAVRLERIVGMNSELLGALTYRPQKTPGLFLSKTNAEMQEFLTILLGLHKYEEAIEQSEKKVKAKQVEYDQQITRVEYATRSVSDVKAQVLMGLRDILGYKTQVAKVQEEYDMATDVASEVQQEMKSLQKAQQDEEAMIVEVHKVEYDAVAKEDSTKEMKGFLDEALRRMNDMDKKEAARSHELRTKQALLMSERTRLMQIRDEQEVLKQKKCPRCLQPWSGASEDMKDYADIDAALDANLQSQATVQQEMMRIDPDTTLLNRAITELRTQIATAEADKKAALAEIRALANEKINEIRAKYKPLVEAKDRSLRLAQNHQHGAQLALVEAQKELEAAEEWNQNAVEQKKAYQVRAQKTETELEEATAKLASIEKELNAERDFLAMTKGFLTSIFDEVLAEIAVNTNRMLSSVPNVAHVQIRFKSESVTAKGTLKKSIQAVAVIGGRERAIKASLSGGMLTAVELAVDLAVRKVISARTGSAPNWLILDECFEGLGPVEKEAAMALLQVAAQDTLILVVDHSSEFKELFTQFVDVEYSNGRSKIAGIHA